MKTSKFSAILILGVAYLIGFVIGGQYGFNPVLSGGASVLGSSIAKTPSGVLATGLDVSQLTTALGNYIKVPQNAASIWKRLYQELELMKYLRKISGQNGSYAGVSSKSTEIMQPFHKNFTAKGGVEFIAYLNKVYHAKVDFVIDNIDEISEGYLHFFADETKLRKDWPVVKYIVHEHFVPQLIEEMNVAMCRGQYAAHDGVNPSSSIATMNGFQTIIAGEILAGNLIPINTGVTSSANGVDNFKHFADSLPSKVSAKGGHIFCSLEMERFYKEDYVATYGGTNDQRAKNNTKLDNYNINIVGLEGWGSSQRMMFSTTGPKGNLLCMYDKIFNPKKAHFDVQQDKRDVLLLTDWHLGVGFNTLSDVYVNDQA